MGRLVAGVDVELAGPRVVIDEQSAALHRDVGVAVLQEPGPHDAVGGSEGGVGVAVAVGRTVDHVGAQLGEDRNGRPGQDVVHVADPGQRFVVDLHRLGAVLGLSPAVGHHQRHRVTDQANRVAGEGGERRQQQIRWPHRRQIGHDRGQLGRGHHRPHAGHRERCGHVDTQHPRVGERTAHERRVQHPREAQVVDVGPATGEDAGVLDPADARSGQAGDHQDPASSARATAVVRVRRASVAATRRR